MSVGRWTLEQWLGLRKIREDFEDRAPTWLGGWRGWGLVKDGAGHLLIGALAGAIPAAFGAPFWAALAAGAAVGIGREVVQFACDDSPNPNLLDRLKDSTEAALGGLLAGGTAALFF